MGYPIEIPNAMPQPLAIRRRGWLERAWTRVAGAWLAIAARFRSAREGAIAVPARDDDDAPRSGRALLDAFVAFAADEAGADAAVPALARRRAGRGVATSRRVTSRGRSGRCRSSRRRRW